MGSKAGVRVLQQELAQQKRLLAQLLRQWIIGEQIDELIPKDRRAAGFQNHNRHPGFGAVSGDDIDYTIRHSRVS